MRGIKLMESTKAGTMSFSVAPKATQKVLTKAAKVSGSGTTAVFGYYALATAPAGHALFTYWLAVLTVLGGFTPARNPMDSRVIRAFFFSPSVLTHHGKNGNLERVGGSMVRLTVTGWNYFSGRLSGQTKGQSVNATDVETLAQAIRVGKMPSAVPGLFPAGTLYRRI